VGEALMILGTASHIGKSLVTAGPGRIFSVPDAACLLAGDIDRGCLFATWLGAIALLEPADRTGSRGFAINRFRGDESLLRPGVDAIERRLGIPRADQLRWPLDWNLIRGLVKQG
jgi:cobyric acid synthase